MVKINPKKGLMESGYHNDDLVVAGVDEVGRGCLAGPVFTASVILDYQAVLDLDDKTKELIRDSKTLSHNQRANIIPIIDELSISKCIGKASAREIEKVGIQNATFLAMHRAIAGLDHEIDVLLVDGNRPLTDYKGPQETVIKGDNLCFCIAAASIVAKEARDLYMQKQATKFPGYGFESHVGYGTKQHMDAMEKIGICTLHRKNFAPVTRLL